jgi:hypothetical protein
MRKADLEVGVDYRVKGYPAGRVRLEGLQGTERHPRMVSVSYYPTDQGGNDHANRTNPHYLSPQDIVARWDDQAEVERRERKAQLDSQAAQARVLLEAFGWTVAQPGHIRSFHDDPQPESWVESGYDGRRVVIRMDAFLRVVGSMPSARELLNQEVAGGA